MTEPKRFQKGKHSYTRYGSKFKEVHKPGKAKPQKEGAPPVSVSVDIDGQTAMGVYANMTMIHRSDAEVVLDFVFLPPGQTKGRTRARVIMPVKQANNLGNLLTNPRKK